MAVLQQDKTRMHAVAGFVGSNLVETETEITARTTWFITQRIPHWVWITGYVVFGVLAIGLVPQVHKLITHGVASVTVPSDCWQILINGSRLSSVLLLQTHSFHRYAACSPAALLLAFAVCKALGAEISLLYRGVSCCSSYHSLRDLQVFSPVKWYYVLVVELVAPAFAVCNAYGAGLTDWNVASTYAKLCIFAFAAWGGKNVSHPAGSVC